MQANKEFKDFDEAYRKFILEVSYALKIDRLLDFLTKILQRLSKYS